jgi:hypothetical protein
MNILFLPLVRFPPLLPNIPIPNSTIFREQPLFELFLLLIYLVSIHFHLLDLQFIYL